MFVAVTVYLDILVCVNVILFILLQVIENLYNTSDCCAIVTSLYIQVYNPMPKID